MTQLTRWDPFRELMSMRSLADRVFEDTLLRPFGFDGTNWELALDIAETDDAYHVEAAIPGVKPEDLDISVVDNVLTIKGEIKREEELKDEQYHLRERRYGSFSRAVTLPSKVDADAIEAVYENGILKLTIPKSEEAKPRRIAVHTAHTIEGESTPAK
ncbi:MAG: Hsp20/alpha crystallin family protein [Chloroflexi bacterium]|nr:Hsp20/alpha crystallin family protein [Chloroflexota bacterium]